MDRLVLNDAVGIATKATCVALKYATVGQLGSDQPVGMLHRDCDTKSGDCDSDDWMTIFFKIVADFVISVRVGTSVGWEGEGVERTNTTGLHLGEISVAVQVNDIFTVSHFDDHPPCSGWGSASAAAVESCVSHLGFESSVFASAILGKNVIAISLEIVIVVIESGVVRITLASANLACW